MRYTAPQFGGKNFSHVHLKPNHHKTKLTMKYKTAAVALMAATATLAQAKTLYIDDFSQPLAMDEGLYDTIEVTGEGELIIESLYAAPNGTVLNIADGASVTLENITVTDSPVSLVLAGGELNISDTPSVTIVLSNDDLSKSGELAFSYFYYDGSQSLNPFESMMLMSSLNSLVNSEIRFVTEDGETYADMTGVGNEMQLLGDLDLNNPSAGSGFQFVIKATNTNVITIPEPATATLSLLALVGMTARRRRK